MTQLIWPGPVQRSCYGLISPLSPRQQAIAPSFSVWFHDWLDALVRRDDAFCQWNANCCATPSLLSQLLDSIESKGIKVDDGIAELSKQLAPGAFGLTSGGSAYFEHGYLVGSV